MLFDAGRSANPDTAYVSDLFSDWAPGHLLDATEGPATSLWTRLCEATADGTQSPLIEEMRRQHLHEALCSLAVEAAR